MRLTVNARIFKFWSLNPNFHLFRLCIFCLLIIIKYFLCLRDLFIIIHARVHKPTLTHTHYTYKYAHTLLPSRSLSLSLSLTHTHTHTQTLPLPAFYPPAWARTRVSAGIKSRRRKTYLTEGRQPGREALDQKKRRQRAQFTAASFEVSETLWTQVFTCARVLAPSRYSL